MCGGMPAIAVDRSYRRALGGVKFVLPNTKNELIHWRAGRMLDRPRARTAKSLLLFPSSKEMQVGSAFLQDFRQLAYSSRVSSSGEAELSRSNTLQSVGATQAPSSPYSGRAVRAAPPTG
jgi:hypothetical protein